MSRADFRRFIGVSLGGGRGKTTAVARLELSSGTLTLAEARARWGQRGGGELADQVLEGGGCVARGEFDGHDVGVQVHLTAFPDGAGAVAQHVLAETFHRQQAGAQAVGQHRALERAGQHQHADDLHQIGVPLDLQPGHVEAAEAFESAHR